MLNKKICDALNSHNLKAVVVSGEFNIVLLNANDSDVFYLRELIRAYKCNVKLYKFFRNNYKYSKYHLEIPNIWSARKFLSVLSKWDSIQYNIKFKNPLTTPELSTEEKVVLKEMYTNGYKVKLSNIHKLDSNNGIIHILLDGTVCKNDTKKFHKVRNFKIIEDNFISIDIKDIAV